MKVIGDFVKSIRRGEDLNLPAQTRRTKEGISLCYNLNSTFSLFLFVFLAAREMSLMHWEIVFEFVFVPAAMQLI